jgi:hypothetical protein
MQVRIVEITLGQADAHAGGARRHALDLALATLPVAGVLMTTDADSKVQLDWIAANLGEVEAGADAVAGVVTFAANACLHIAPSRNAEWQLAQLQARMHSLLDPRPQERWPTHIWTWGASLAVRADVYRAGGGLPSVPLAEDRAFAEILDRQGFRVRRSNAPVVITSHRRHGRAPGGLADLLSAYADDGAPCDAALEPTATLARRLVWRAHLRAHYVKHGPQLCGRMAHRLGIKIDALPTRHALTFGEWWTAIERASARLQRARIMPIALALEIGRAQRLINLVEIRARQGGTAASAVGVAS